MATQFRIVGLVVAAIFLSVGCGGGGGGGGSQPASAPAPAPSPDPDPATLVSLYISPNSANLVVGEKLLFTCTGTYSDGSQKQEMTPIWVVADKTIATQNALTGPSVEITGVSAGTTQLNVSMNPIYASLAISVVAFPADPGPVYGWNDLSGFLQYPTMATGGPAKAVAIQGMSKSGGMYMDRANQFVYLSSGGDVYKVDPIAGSGTLFQSVGGLILGVSGDSQGQIYTQDYNTGDIHKIDPNSGAATLVGTANPGMLAMDIGPHDQLYSNPMIATGGAWIFRNDLVTGTGAVFADIYSGAIGPPNIYIIIPAGVAIDQKSGTVYTATYLDYRVFAYDDVNGDGDAKDAGESRVHASLPIAYGNAENTMMGVWLAKSGSVLANVSPKGGNDAGVYWIKDENGDGDTDDPNAVVKYNNSAGYGGSTVETVVAPR